VSRIRQRTDQENEIFTNQTSFTTSFNTLDLKHDLTGGLELIYERQYTLGTGTSAQTINGVTYTAISNPAANLYNPSDNDDLGTPYLTGVNTEGKTTTGALYLADTVTVNPSFKFNGGLRFERYHTETTSGTIVTSSNSSTYPAYAVGSVAPVNLKDSDNLTSWNLGAVYKPTADGTVYVSWANSSTPPGSANFSLSATSTNQANPNMDPQETRSVELGTKWDVLDKRVNLSAAVYRTVNNNQISYDDLGNAVQEGKLTVQGLELGAVGQVMKDWQVSSGLAWMDPHQDNQWNSTHTTETTGVRWSPRFTATFWTAYDWGDFSLGGGASYVGKQKLTVTAGTDLSTTNMPQIGAYWVASLMGSYKVNRNVKLQLNVANLFDRDYIASLNNSGARAKLGTPRTVQLTAAVQF
jgi:catecholate siderophore receptor